MRKANYIVFDTETGGLDHKVNPILEIALVTLDGNTLKEINRYETYVKPEKGKIIEEEALNVNGIKMRDVNEQGISIKEFRKNIIAYVKKDMGGSHPSLKPIVVGHNIMFDIRMMDSAFEGEKKLFSDYISDVVMDTMLDAKRAFPKATSLKLGNVCEMVGIKLVNAHRAMPDVLSTADLFRYFSNKLRSNDSAPESKEKTKEKKEQRPRDYFQF